MLTNVSFHLETVSKNQYNSVLIYVIIHIRRRKKHLRQSIVKTKEKIKKRKRRKSLAKKHLYLFGPQSKVSTVPSSFTESEI